MHDQGHSIDHSFGEWGGHILIFFKKNSLKILGKHGSLGGPHGPHGPHVVRPLVHDRRLQMNPFVWAGARIVRDEFFFSISYTIWATKCKKKTFKVLLPILANRKTNQVLYKNSARYFWGLNYWENNYLESFPLSPLYKDKW